MSDGSGGTDVVTGADRAVDEPADRALGYGRRAADQGVRVAEAPPAKKTPKAPPTKPAHVLAAEAERDRLAPFLLNSTLKKKVRIYDLARFRVKAVADFAVVQGQLAAWTNSSTEIFVVPNLDAPANYGVLRAALYHEFLHVDQFHAAGGRPPAKYRTMFEYELDAYKKSADWLRNPTDGEAPNEAIAKEMDKGLRFVKQALSKQRSEKDYKDLLVNHKPPYLPQHKGGIESLYCRQSPCQLP
jgi:hypothetical protein